MKSDSSPSEERSARAVIPRIMESMTDPKKTLVDYLQSARDAIVWKVEDLSEYDARRPMTPTGTNLLGLVKHVASMEAGYFGETFGRPFPDPLPWFDEGADEGDDMWATPDESRDYIVELYRHACAHADETIASRDLDSIGSVPWWPPERRDVPLHLVLVHMIAETERHAGHADIVRELVDGAVGVRPDNSNMTDHDATWWSDYRSQL